MLLIHQPSVTDFKDTKSLSLNPFLYYSNSTYIIQIYSIKTHFNSILQSLSLSLNLILLKSNLKNFVQTFLPSSTRIAHRNPNNTSQLIRCH